MANRKRETPLTDDERKARNRNYQSTRRHKTNNQYSRAYRKAGQRAIKYVQRYHNSIWYQYLDEELEKFDPNSPNYQHSSKTFKGTPANRNDCEHNGDVYVMGVGIGCAICGAALGEQQLTTDQRITIAEIIGAVDYVKKLKEAS